MGEYSYTRDQLFSFCARLVLDGRWSMDDAATYIRQYDDGTLALQALPLTPGTEGPRLVDVLRGLDGQLPEL